MEITVLKEQARGCGYRHSGQDGVGLYLMGSGIFEICERLPFPLGVCPCCGEGIKFGRGFTWITPTKLFAPNLKPKCILAEIENDSSYGAGSILRAMKDHNHKACFLCSPPEGKHGLLWVGDKFYTPGSFMQESVTMGISKRIASIPHGFEIGETVVYLAHNKAIESLEVPVKEGEFVPGDFLEKSKIEYIPAVFTVFKPNRVDIVVDTTNPEELPERAKSIAKKLGDKARIVKVEPEYEQQSLLKEAE